MLLKPSLSRLPARASHLPMQGAHAPVAYAAVSPAGCKEAYCGCCFGAQCSIRPFDIFSCRDGCTCMQGDRQPRKMQEQQANSKSRT